MSWDHRYRRLEMGEIILETDEVMKDDGTWIVTPNCVGTPAPDPAYTSHRWYRRLMTPAPDVQRAQLNPDLMQALRSALRFAGSRSAITSEQEKAILVALSRPQTDGEAQTRPALQLAREALDDAAATLLAVRATAGAADINEDSDDWKDGRSHFFVICGETIERINEALSALRAGGDA